MFETLEQMLETAVFDQHYPQQLISGGFAATCTELARLGVNLSVPDAAGTANTTVDAVSLAKAAVAGQALTAVTKSAALSAFDKLVGLSTVQAATAWQPVSLASRVIAGPVIPQSRIIAGRTVDLAGIVNLTTDILANGTLFTLAVAPLTPQTVTLRAQVFPQPPSLSIATNGVCTTNSALYSVFTVVLDTKYGAPS